jgi:predicted RNA binding protein YcfA (HicA-like mRNA interferase family)
MPPKVRQLKADLRKAGFSWRPGKGSHTVWEHPLLPTDSVTLSGGDGDDAKPYQEQDVRKILARLRNAQRRRS